LEDADDVGSVYTNATNQFLIRYGYDLPFDENVDGDPEDHPPSDEPVDDKEQDRRDEIRGQLHAVCVHFLICPVCVLLTANA
jgi:hypothetical protein